MATRTRAKVQSAAVKTIGRAANGGEWLTVDEACEIVRLSRRTFERHLARGTGPRVNQRQRKGAIRIRREWLEEWMEEGAA